MHLAVRVERLKPAAHRISRLKPIQTLLLLRTVLKLSAEHLTWCVARTRCVAGLRQMPRHRGVGMPKKKTKKAAVENPASTITGAEEAEPACPSTPPRDPPAPPPAPDPEPPGTPGEGEVPAALTLTRVYAQKVAQARLRWRASIAKKNSAVAIYNVICKRLEQMPRKQWKRVHENKLDKATAALNAATIAAREAECEFLSETVCFQMCQLEVRDAKLRSLRRRLRRKKMFRFMRWGRR